ncbi:MAG: hypothetical protein H6835_13660 [Planctomycetes bacterium]|nr:hypothetical protein [Planctomycetota bacterium]
MLMWTAWTVLAVSVAMWLGLKLGRPLYYSDGAGQVGADALVDAGMLRWAAPEPRFEVPGRITGRVARLPDGRLLYAVLTDDGTSDLVTWHPARPDVPPEPAYGLNSGDNEVAPAVGADGQVWFASDREGTVGGYDLFVSTWTPRGFGVVQPMLPCNTALDETDPAPDAAGDRVVFVRIDRRANGGDDGVLWHWRIGDALDPQRVFPPIDRRSDTIDRDPAFAADGVGLWFVRREGRRLEVCRATRLGDHFDAAAVVSREWTGGDLRSPLPTPDGRELGLLQVGSDGPALYYVAEAHEVLPWWPGQRWLEWLLLSLALCAGLLLLLLYLGQRWQALDLLAQCLLLSLLLHVLLFLWLMGVEIAGALLPGDVDDGSGMQVQVVAATDRAAASGAATGGDVAARASFTPQERHEQVAAPGTGVERSARAHDSLQVENGRFAVEPAAEQGAPAPAALEDAAAESPKRDAPDAVSTLAATALPAVGARAADAHAVQAAAAAAARRWPAARAGRDAAGRVLLVGRLSRWAPSPRLTRRPPCVRPAVPVAQHDADSAARAVAMRDTAATAPVAAAAPAPTAARAAASLSTPAELVVDAAAMRVLRGPQAPLMPVARCRRSRRLAPARCVPPGRRSASPPRNELSRGYASARARWWCWRCRSGTPWAQPDRLPRRSRRRPSPWRCRRARARPSSQPHLSPRPSSRHAALAANRPRARASRCWRRARRCLARAAPSRRALLHVGRRRRPPSRVARR